MQATLSFQDTISAVVALAAAIRAYYTNWKEAPYSLPFWLFEARAAYGVYRRLGGTSRFHEIIAEAR